MWEVVNMLYHYETPITVTIEGKNSNCYGKYFDVIPVGQKELLRIPVVSSTYNRYEEKEVMSINTPHKGRDVIVGWVAIMISFVAFVYIAEKS